MENFSKSNDSSHEKISGIFKCFQCDFKCGTAVDLKEHYQIHRSEFPFKCFQCSYNGKDAEDFKQHSLTHFEQSYYKCPKCDYRAKYRQNITSHDRYTHKLLCACGTQFKSKEDFSQHLIDQPDCKKKIESSDDEREIEGESKVKSPAKFNRLSDGNDMSEQNNDMPQGAANSNQVYVCQICFYIFRSSNELDDHTIKIHSEEPHTVTVNEEYEGNSDSEYQSQALSEDAKFFLCSECHFIYSSRKDLEEHLRTHQRGHTAFNMQETAYTPIVEMTDDTEEVEYVCYICDKAFGSEKAVKLHMGHHPDIKFRCPKCGLSMKSQASLKTHMATHPSLKASKKNENQLTRKIHDTTMYKCASCPYETKFHDNLQIHLTTHSKRDPSKRKIKPTFKVRFGRK